MALSDPVGAMEATWPPVAVWQTGPWTLRQGGGGGKRVAAASATGAVSEADLIGAEAAMAALGQERLFLLRPTDTGWMPCWRRRGTGWLTRC